MTAHIMAALLLSWAALVAPLEYRAGSVEEQAQSPLSEGTQETREAAQCRFGEDSWQNYQRLHEEGLKNISEGKPTRVLVWRCRSKDLCGGNSDQLRGMLKVFYLAVATDRVFLADWHRAELDMSEVLAPRHIDWRVPEGLQCPEQMLRTRSLNKEPWPVLLSKNGPDCVSIRTNKDPVFNDTSDAGLAEYRPGCAARFLFEPTQALQAQVARHRPPAVPAGKPYAAVHLRVGDMWMDNPLYFKKFYHSGDVVLSSAVDCAQQMAGQEEDDRLPVVVFADSSLIKSLAVNASWLEEHELTGSVFTTVEEDGTPLIPSHTDDGHNEGVNGEENQAPSVEELQKRLWNAWSDQWCLVGAEYVVKSSWSGYAKMAAEIALLSPTGVNQFFVKGDPDAITSVRCQKMSSNSRNVFW